MRHVMTRSVGTLALIVLFAACNGGSDSSPSNGGGGGGTPPVSTSTIVITSSGASPRNITVPRGTQVTFVNNDSRPHDMHSDPHPAHGDCPEIDVVGHLIVGQSKQTANMNTAGSCGYHDHNQPSVASLQGTITVQ